MSKEQLMKAIREEKLDVVKTLLEQDFVKELSLADKFDIFQSSILSQTIIYDNVINNQNFLSNITFKERLDFPKKLLLLIHKKSNNKAERTLEIGQKTFIFDRIGEFQAILDEADEQQKTSLLGAVGALCGIYITILIMAAAIVKISAIMMPLVFVGTIIGSISIYGLAVSLYSNHQVTYNERVSSHTENASLGLLKPDAKEPVRTNETGQAL